MTAANATSYRRRFRYAKELRRYSQFKKWNTVALPKPPLISGVTALAGGINKIGFSTGSGYNNSQTPVVEHSTNGTSGWTNVAVTGWASPATILTTASVVSGLKYFRVRTKNEFGESANSNIVQATVLA